MKVYNKHHKDAPPDAVYVGRPTKWGNPFVVGIHGARGQCVELFREDIHDFKTRDPLSFRKFIEPLRGKSLVCWCAPAACHADILMELANE